MKKKELINVTMAIDERTLAQLDYLTSKSNAEAKVDVVCECIQFVYHLVMEGKADLKRKGE